MPASVLACREWDLGSGGLKNESGSLRSRMGTVCGTLAVLGFMMAFEERLQVGLRVSADMHDLVAGRGRGRRRRLGALRGRLGQRLLRGFHGCGLAQSFPPGELRSGSGGRVAGPHGPVLLHARGRRTFPALPGLLPAPFLRPGRCSVPTETVVHAFIHRRVPMMFWFSYLGPLFFTSSLPPSLPFPSHFYNMINEKPRD